MLPDDLLPPDERKLEPDDLEGAPDERKLDPEDLVPDER
jgi:hypothetical protein